MIVVSLILLFCFCITSCHGVDKPSRRSLGGDRYIVVFHDTVENVDEKVTYLVDKVHASLLHKYTASIKGFAAKNITRDDLTTLISDKDVNYIEEDVTMSQHQVTQRNAPWHLDRIDQESLPLDDLFSYAYDGSGVTVFVVDSGVRLDHEQLFPRATCGINTVEDETCEDLSGHGTHVAGIAAGRTYGVAKNSDIVSVKVFNSKGSSSLSKIIEGIDYIAAEKKRRPWKPMVANMSFGGPPRLSLEEAINEANAAGVTMVASAGNNYDNACDYTPAKLDNVITVAAVTSNDERPIFSNYGNCTNIFAPGTLILSSIQTSDTATGYKDGTSMAAPHVTGAVALYLQRNPDWTPGAIRSTILAESIFGVVSKAGDGSPNRLLFTGDIMAPSGNPPSQVPPPNSRPTPTPTLRKTRAPTRKPTRAPTRNPTPSPGTGGGGTCLAIRESCQFNSQCCSGNCFWSRFCLDPR